MPGKDGGKKKPVKKAKQAAKDLSEEDVAYQSKQKDDKKAMKEAADKLKSGKKK